MLFARLCRQLNANLWDELVGNVEKSSGRVNTILSTSFAKINKLDN